MNYRVLIADEAIADIFGLVQYIYTELCNSDAAEKLYHNLNREVKRLKIKIFNREICVCALLATNSLMRKKRRRNGEKYGRFSAKVFRLDTDVNEDIRKVRCDVALIPIGGHFTMDKKQAAEYVADIKPGAVIPTHYGSIVGNKTDGQDFRKRLEEIDKSISVALKLG